MVTKEYLDSISFEIAKQKYYNANKVDAKLEELKQGVLELLEENEKLRSSGADAGAAEAEISAAVLDAQAQAAKIIDDAHSEATAIALTAQNDATTLLSAAKDEAVRIISGANKKASEITENAKKQSEAFSMRQLDAIDKINKQLDDLNVTHATHVLRLKQALMQMATEK